MCRIIYERIPIIARLLLRVHLERINRSILIGQVENRISPATFYRSNFHAYAAVLEQCFEYR